MKTTRALLTIASIIGLTLFFANTSQAQALTDTITVVNNVHCNGGNDGSIFVTAQGGTAPYLYAWSTGDTAAALIGYPAGTYSVTVTDNLGATVTNSVTITEPTPLVVTAQTTQNTSSASACDGSVIANVSGGTPPYTYLWSNAQATASMVSLCIGTYNLTVADANNCTTGSSTAIYNGSTFTVQPHLVNNVHCYGACDGKAYANVIGGMPPYSYLWYHNNNNVISDTISNMCPGWYYIAASDNNGNTVYDSLLITQPNPLLVTTNIIQNATSASICDGSVNAIATGGTGPYSYLWSTSPVQTTATITALCPGTYQVTVTDANACSYSTSATIINDSLLAVHTYIINQVTCHGACNGKAYVNARGGTAPYTYLWNTLSTTDTIQNLCAGVYTVTVTDNAGATFIDSVIITEPAALVTTAQMDAHTSTSSACDGSAQATTTGGVAPYTYTWPTPSSQWAPGVDSAYNLCMGNYDVTVTDVNGCTATANYTILDYTPLSLSLSTGNVSCNGFQNGDVSTFVIGGQGPHTYLWSNGSTQSFISNLSPGTYSVTVTDSVGTSISDTTTVTEPAPLVAIVTNDSNTTCGACNGMISVGISGGTSPYYNWWNYGGSGNQVNNLCAGIYVDTVYDYHGCSLLVSDTITSIGICDVWPGDANNDLVVDNYDVLDIGQGYGLTGPVRSNASLAWVGQPATDWTDTIPAGNNAKYADCDGNGTINADDTLAVTQNYGLTHQKTDGTSKTGPEVYIQFPMVDSTQAGLPVQVPIFLGDSTNPVTGIYGIAFSVNYDTALVKENTFQLTAGNSWLGTPGVNLLTFGKDLYSQAKTDITLVRTNHSNTSGFGPLCTSIYVMKDDISGKRQIVKAFSPSITNVRAIMYDGTIVPLDNSRTDTMFVTQDSVTGIHQLPLNSQVKLYPNPTNNQLILDAGTSQITQYLITDMVGKQLIDYTGNVGTQTIINTAKLAPGMYLLLIWSGQQKAVAKFSIVR